MGLLAIRRGLGLYANLRPVRGYAELLASSPLKPDRVDGVNLLVVRDRRIATAYMVEAIRIFDHYHFRVAQSDASKAHRKLALRKPPGLSGKDPWWREDYADPVKIRDRKIFA